MKLSPWFEQGFAQSHPWWPHGGCCASNNHYATELWKVSIEFGLNQISQKLAMINEPSQVIGKSFTTVGTLTTHTPQWTVQAMGFKGLWVAGGGKKISAHKSHGNLGKS